MEIECKHKESIHSIHDLSSLLYNKYRRSKIQDFLIRCSEPDLVEELLDYQLKDRIDIGHTNVELLRRVSRTLDHYGRGYFANTLYMYPEVAKEEIKSQQRIMIEHIRDCCGGGDFLDELWNNILGQDVSMGSDLLDHISGKQEYWVVVWGIYSIFDGRPHDARVDDSLFGCIPIFRKVLETRFDKRHYMDRNLFSGASMSPRCIVDFVTCYYMYMFFQELVPGKLRIDIRAEDVLKLERISDTFPAIYSRAKLASCGSGKYVEIQNYIATEEADDAEEINDRRGVVGIEFWPDLISDSDRLDDASYHIRGMVREAYYIYKINAGGETLLQCDTIQEYDQSSEHLGTIDMDTTNTGTIDIFQLMDLLKMLAENDVSIFVDLEEVKLEKYRVPKSARGARPPT